MESGEGMKIKKAIQFTNGMLMVFDDNGQQVPEYQGIATEMIPKLKKDHPCVSIENMDWNRDVRPGLLTPRPR
jgi:hypothetical protein